MSIRVRRLLNAFVLGTLAALVAFIIDDYENLSNAIKIGDWTSLRALAVSAIFGALVAGLRAAQMFIGPVPSPEPEENR